jgi:hypothetical protein
MPKVKYYDFDKGLWFDPQPDRTPPGGLRRARGISAEEGWRSRPGSPAIQSSTAAHSIYYFRNRWFYGVGTTLQCGSGSILTGLDGNRLSFMRMPPTAGRRDHLYAFGGGKNRRISPIDESLVQSENYVWVDSTGAANEWYLASRDPEGGSSYEQVPLRQPSFIDENGVTLIYSSGNVGSLTAGQWDWGDNDTLGFSTVYVRLSDDADPNGKADGYLRIGYVDEIGISPPEQNVSASGTSTGGGLTGTYRYRCTYFNSLTGVRSNPSVRWDSSAYNTVLLMHCTGTTGSTTFADSSPSSMTITAQGSAQITNTQKKFNNTSIALNESTTSSGDYFTIENRPELYFGASAWSVDFWVRFTSLENGKYYGLFGMGDSLQEVGAWRVYMYQWSDGSKTRFRVHRNGGEAGTIGGDWSVWHDETPALSTGTWYHIAIARLKMKGVDWTYPGWQRFGFYVNGSVGIMAGFGASDLEFGIPGGSTGTFYFGCYYWGSAARAFLHGYLDEIRIVKGEDAVTYGKSSFTPATTTYLETGAEVTVTAKDIVLTGIPQPLDPQVDSVELWRTNAGGTSFFRTAIIPKGVTTHIDKTPDASLELLELPRDNDQPMDWLEEVAYYNASAFWLTRSEIGDRGRVFYSPVGRPEAVEGYIDITGDDDPLQGFVNWSGQLAVFSESGVFQILGNNPYWSRRIAGVPGTTAPHSIVETPYGLVYLAADGVRIFTGTRSDLVAPNRISRLFAGENVEQLNAWPLPGTGTVATYARNEYILSDTTKTLAVDLSEGRWRDLGVGCNVLWYNAETDQIAAELGGAVVSLESTTGAYTDNGTAIPFTIEPHHSRFMLSQKAMIRNVTLDGVTGTGTLTITAKCGIEGSLELGTFKKSSRGRQTYAVNKGAACVGVLIDGNCSTGAATEIYGVEVDAYVPKEEED